MTQILQLGRLEARIEAVGGGVRVTLAGRLDDSSLLGKLAVRLPPGDVAIDCGGITFVNSFGVREWTLLVRALRDQGTVTLERVTDALMTQMNPIPEFAPPVRITSFYAQYVCPTCGAEPLPLVDAIAHADELAAMRAPPIPCAECGAEMELADFPERYLGLFCPD
ncbi:MAG TPA: hypothetical protein VK932_10260 [Kofleriaceae bacterium]|nr:hypothetical protein [Kofleriaceae bacterium]